METVKLIFSFCSFFAIWSFISKISHKTWKFFHFNQLVRFLLIEFWKLTAIEICFPSSHYFKVSQNYKNELNNSCSTLFFHYNLCDDMDGCKNVFKLRILWFVKVLRDCINCVFTVLFKLGQIFTLKVHKDTIILKQNHHKYSACQNMVFW